jgi:predicted DNA binding CopG/RHH family protein
MGIVTRWAGPLYPASNEDVEMKMMSKDLEAIQKRALAEGLPYQTLISSLLHKYASGRLKGV